MTITRQDLGDYAGRFAISESEADRILTVSDTIEEFKDTWKNQDWWTDANQPSEGDLEIGNYQSVLQFIDNLDQGTHADKDAMLTMALRTAMNQLDHAQMVPVLTAIARVAVTADAKAAREQEMRDAESWAIPKAE